MFKEFRPFYPFGKFVYLMDNPFDFVIQVGIAGRRSGLIAPDEAAYQLCEY